MLLNEISILNWYWKQSALPNVAGHHLTHCGPEPSRRQGENLPTAGLWELAHGSSLAPGLQLTPSGPVLLRPLDLDWTTPLAFLALQLAEGRQWDILASIIVWTDSLQPLSHIYINIYIIWILPNKQNHWFCISGDTWPTQTVSKSH